MAKQRYDVTIEVCRSYTVPVQASSLEEAGLLAAKIKATDAEDGEREDFEINVMAVTKATDDVSVKFPDILKHTWANWRVFKAAKRREARAVDDALDDLRMGCAYMPSSAYRLAARIMDDMKELRKQLSCKEWGR